MTDRHAFLARLIAGYLRNQLSSEEREALNAWLEERSENRRFLADLEDTRHLEHKLRVFHQADRARLWALTQTKLTKVGGVRPHGRIHRIKKWFPYAAACLIAVATAGWFFYKTYFKPLPEVVTQLVADVQPGGNSATLTLADGRTIFLDEGRNGIVVGGSEITYNDGNALAEVESGEDIAFLELTTPKGGTYQITLPDGTHVWLNAASTLKYPSHFSSVERRVELIGEAYFSVATQEGKPFRVINKGQEVVVFGTEFNVTAYADETDIKTTLVEGKVQILNVSSGMKMPLLPNQQSVVDESGIQIQHVDVRQYVAWKNGYFSFDQTPFEEMMRQLARWYDVDVVYTGSIPKETFSGEMGRDLTLSAVLKLLNVSAIEIQITEGNKLLVR